MTKSFDDSQDAVFLPGKIHGCDYQVYIIYQNEQANEGKGSWEIEIIDCYRILMFKVFLFLRKTIMLNVMRTLARSFLLYRLI